MRLRLLPVLAIAGLSLIGRIVWVTWPPETVLPNGFVIRGESTVLSNDRRTVLSDDAEFLCFDDRFMLVTSMRGTGAKLLDSQIQGPVDEDKHAELSAPGGLLYGPNACNGYHTAVIGPGLLHDGASSPFLPTCKSFNRSNPKLKDRDWFNRPCFDR